MNDDMKHDLASFTGAFTRRALDNLWADGSSVYGLAREAAVRTAKGITFGVAGAAIGTVAGFLIGPKPQECDHYDAARARVLNNLRTVRTLRQMLPMVEGALGNWEAACVSAAEGLAGDLLHPGDPPEDEEPVH